MYGLLTMWYVDPLSPLSSSYSLQHPSPFYRRVLPTHALVNAANTTISEETWTVRVLKQQAVGLSFHVLLLLHLPAGFVSVQETAPCQPVSDSYKCLWFGTFN